MVIADNLAMTFRVPVRAAGIRATLRSLTRREVREVKAVQGVSFALEPGEVVGFIGPNGAGKTTTLKMLSGILHPTGGQAKVLGQVPWRRERSLLSRIALIRGSRPLASPGELTVMDALRFQRLVYEVSEKDFKRNLDELSELLGLDGLLERQVRALSLGERTRAGLAHALIYRPEVLFLDEPTIGLDVSAVAVVRHFIRDYSRQTGATVLLTSHYMADVQSLCRRVILIDKGTLAFDGDLTALSAQLSPYKLLDVTLEAASDALERYGEVLEQEGSKARLRVARNEIPTVTARLLAELPVSDLSVSEPPLESVIDQVYREGIAP